MRSPYAKLFAMLVLVLGFFFVFGTFDNVRIFGHAVSLLPLPDRMPDAGRTQAGDTSVATVRSAVSEDTLRTVKSILMAGDSMFENLSRRLAAYAHANDMQAYVVVWYGSTTENWAESGRLREYVQQFRPDAVMLCIGGNELFVRDVDKRISYVRQIVEGTDGVPYVWIGPANWTDDTGITTLIRQATGDSLYFDSGRLSLPRAEDGIHPTRRAANLWGDSIVTWLNRRPWFAGRMLDVPRQETAYPDTLILFSPDD